jgi:hypothetical protein
MELVARREEDRQGIDRSEEFLPQREDIKQRGQGEDRGKTDKAGDLADACPSSHPSRLSLTFTHTHHVSHLQ